MPTPKLHRLHESNPDSTYLLLAAMVGTNKYGRLEGFPTDPYGELEYAYGSGDDFICGDFFVRRLSDFSLHYPVPDHAVLVTHIVRNSETASFIEDANYTAQVVNLRNLVSLRAAVQNVSCVWHACAFDEVRHDTRGWNQHPEYFMRDIHISLLRMFASDAGDAIGTKYLDQLSAASVRRGIKAAPWIRKELKLALP